jgi:hypothetical protein
MSRVKRRDAVKGTGFNPYIKLFELRAALAAEELLQELGWNSRAGFFSKKTH